MRPEEYERTDARMARLAEEARIAPEWVDAALTVLARRIVRAMRRGEATAARADEVFTAERVRSILDGMVQREPHITRPVTAGTERGGRRDG